MITAVKQMTFMAFFSVTIWFVIIRYEVNTVTNRDKKLFSAINTVSYPFSIPRQAHRISAARIRIKPLTTPSITIGFFSISLEARNRKSIPKVTRIFTGMFKISPDGSAKHNILK
jgi:hypothetical protein